MDYAKHFELFIKKAMIHAKCTICGERKSFLPRAMEHLRLMQILMWCETHFNHNHMEESCRF